MGNVRFCDKHRLTSALSGSESGLMSRWRRSLRNAWNVRKGSPDCPSDIAGAFMRLRSPCTDDLKDARFERKGELLPTNHVCSLLPAPCQREASSSPLLKVYASI